METLKSELKRWIALALGNTDFEIQPLKGDASFRTYSRVLTKDKSYIAMLAPVDFEDTHPFVTIARIWQKHGIEVPTIYGWEPSRGFVLLSDFGDTLLSSRLTIETVDSYYFNAMQILLSLQNIQDESLPLFNHQMIRVELSYFEEWFLEKLLGLNIEPQKAMLEKIFDELILCCVQQDQVTTHRDYHSRNIMIQENGRLGIIDFQDAVRGPITYDLVSLLKDCYVNWPSEKIMAWVNIYYQHLQAQGKIKSLSQAEFYRWFHFVGLQRHLKVLGIFSRLKIRDNKPHYILDMPRIINYVLQVTSSYAIFADFHQWLCDIVVPPLEDVCEELKVQVA